MSAATIATVCAETAETMNRTAMVMGKGIVELLAAKYGFDAAEAFEAISFEVPKKAKKAAEKKDKAAADGSDADASDKGGKKKSKKTGPAMPLPFVGIVKAEWCMGIRTNQGLFTQCTQAKPTDGEYCPTCKKQADTNASGKPTYGNINDRVAAFEAGTEWRDPKENKAVANYANVAAKLKIDLEAAKAECLSVFGVAIPDDQLQVKVTQRGRPKKDTSAIVSDTESAASGASGEKKKGRPKKVKAVIEGGAAGDDLIAGLVAAAQNGDAKPKKAKTELTEEEKEAKKKAAAEKRAATLAEKKANQPPKAELSDEEKAAKRKEAAEKRKATAEAKQAAYIQAAVQAALIAQGLSSAAPSTAGSSGSESTTPVKTAKQSDAAPAPAPAVDAELEIEDLEEENLEVDEWDCPADGKTYLKSANNVLYDVDTQDEVGIWNESKQIIESLPTDDDEDDMC